ncbi:MAG: YHS domain-containing protein [Chloroflexi bacterium]|nr:YHS domain-containing protein [Chloroflexota bacterium]
MRIPLFSKPSPKAIDPVCAMKVNMEKPHGGTHTLDGVTYYFCGPGCNRAFQNEPEEYLSGRKKVDM